MIQQTSREHAVIIGSLLGDGFMQRSTSLTNKSRLRFCHSIKQKEYVDWKRTSLTRLCEKTQSSKIVLRSRGNAAASEMPYEQYLFYTQYKTELAPYHTLFYKKKTLASGKIRYVKQVPINLSDYLTDPLSLAVWYCDDGTLRKDCNAARIATQGFNYDEHLILQECLSTTFGIGSKIESWKSSSSSIPYYGLSIPARHFGSLREAVYSIVKKEIPSMLYKLERKTP